MDTVEMEQWEHVLLMFAWVLLHGCCCMGGGGAQELESLSVQGSGRMSTFTQRRSQIIEVEVWSTEFVLQICQINEMF